MRLKLLFIAVDIQRYRTTLIFRPLRTSRFVTAPIVDDTEYTQEVVVMVTLSLRTTGVDVLLNPNTASIKILDDDGWFFSLLHFNSTNFTTFHSFRATELSVTYLHFFYTNV